MHTSENGVNFGAEQSGHIILGDAKTGDAIMGALQVAACIVESQKSSAEVLNPFELTPKF